MTATAGFPWIILAAVENRLWREEKSRETN
jgi:hypothetical protein